MAFLRKNKVVLFIIIFVIISLIAPEVAHAKNGTLESVHSEAVINNDGTVDIIQTWIFDDTHIKKGTEHYINMNVAYEKGGFEEYISEYGVYRNGQKMNYEPNWNSNETLEQKYNKYGVIRLRDNNIELVFGISEKERNIFEVKYKVHNVVKETTDNEKYLHWSFTPTELNPSPKKMTSEIFTRSPVEISKIYGFNYEGQVGFLDNERNHVFAEMTGKYKSSSTLNIFVLLDDKNNLVQGTNKTNESLEEKAKKMLKGSDYNIEHFYNDNFETMESSKVPFWKNISIGKLKEVKLENLIGFSIFAFFFIIDTLKSVRNEERILMSNIPKDLRKKLKKDKDFYYREKPEDVQNIMFLLPSIMSIHGYPKNIMEYLIAKWTSERVFEFIKEEESKFLFLEIKEITFSIHPEKIDINNELEKELFSTFEAISKDGVISSKDLYKIDAKKIKSILSKKKKKALSNLIELGYIEVNRNKPTKFSKRNLMFTEEGLYLITNHVGMRNYLEQFTLINERSYKEIELWDYYFHLAALYEQADKFKENLDQFPSLSGESEGKYKIYYGNTGSSILSSTVSAGVHNAYNSQNSRKSSSGGGSGSSGGGRGGGTR